MKNYFLKAVIFCSSLLFISSLYSCKENIILPSELIPEVDNINTFRTDTNSIITHTVLQDSFPTGGTYNSVRIATQSINFHGIGTILADPTFGKTYGASHVEVVPPNSNFSFKTNYPGTSRTIDSVVLSIPYKYAYGDTLNNSNQTFKVYRSLQSFSRDSAQFDFTRDVINTSELLGTASINFKTLKWDTLYGSIKQIPTIHFKLASWVKDSIEAQVDLGTNGAAADFSKFLAWWKGFYILPDTNQGSTIGYFDTYNTKLKIYYRYTNTDNKADTTVDAFSFDPNSCNRFNTVVRNFQGTPIESTLTNIPATGHQNLFIQNAPGVVAEVKLPYLYRNPNVMVNKAELVFTAISPFFSWTDTALFRYSPRLQILKSKNGNDSFVDDYLELGTTYVDGNRKVATIGGMNYIQYRFKITKSIQDIITQKDSTFSFKITGINNSGTPGAFRTILQGTGNNSLPGKPYLDIIYTKIK